MGKERGWGIRLKSVDLWEWDKCKNESSENLVSGYRTDMIRGCSCHVSQKQSWFLWGCVSLDTQSRDDTYNDTSLYLQWKLAPTCCHRAVWHCCCWYIGNQEYNTDCMTHTESDWPIFPCLQKVRWQYWQWNDAPVFILVFTSQFLWWQLVVI